MSEFRLHSDICLLPVFNVCTCNLRFRQSVLRANGSVVEGAQDKKLAVREDLEVQLAK